MDQSCGTCGSWIGDEGPNPPDQQQFVACSYEQVMPEALRGPDSGMIGIMVERFSDEMEASDEIQDVCDKLVAQVQERTNEKFENFRAVKYRSHFEPRGYLIKVLVGKEEGDNYIHMSVFHPHGNDPELTGVEKNKTREDLLDPLMDEGARVFGIIK